MDGDVREWIIQLADYLQLLPHKIIVGPGTQKCLGTPGFDKGAEDCMKMFEARDIPQFNPIGQYEPMEKRDQWHFGGSEETKHKFDQILYDASLLEGIHSQAFLLETFQKLNDPEYSVDLVYGAGESPAEHTMRGVLQDVPFMHEPAIATPDSHAEEEK